MPENSGGTGVVRTGSGCGASPEQLIAAAGALSPIIASVPATSIVILNIAWFLQDRIERGKSRPDKRLRQVPQAASVA